MMQTTQPVCLSKYYIARGIAAWAAKGILECSSIMCNEAVGDNMGLDSGRVAGNLQKLDMWVSINHWTRKLSI